MKNITVFFFAFFFLAFFNAEGQRGSQTPVGGLSYAPDSNYVIVSKFYKGRNGVAVWEPVDSLNIRGSTDFGQILFVSKTGGNNTTAQKGNLEKPWSDPYAAKYASAPGDLIYVVDGRWKIGTDIIVPATNYDSTTLLIDSVDWFWNYNTGLVVDGNERIFYDTTGVKCNHYGFMNFRGVNTANNCMYAGDTLSRITIEFDTLNLGDGAGFNYFADFDKFASWQVNIRNHISDRSENFHVTPAATDTVRNAQLIINIDNQNIVSDVDFRVFPGGYYENVQISYNVKNAIIEYEYYNIDFDDVNGVWKNCSVSVHFENCLIKQTDHSLGGSFIRSPGGPHSPGTNINYYVSGNYTLNNAGKTFNWWTNQEFDGHANTDTITFNIINTNLIFAKSGTFRLQTRNGANTSKVNINNVTVQSKGNALSIGRSAKGAKYYINNSSFQTITDTAVVLISDTSNTYIGNSVFIRNTTAPENGGAVFVSSVVDTINTAAVYSNETVPDTDLTFISITQHPTTAAGTNIYTSNGTLASNRTITGAGNNLTFTGMNNLTATGSGSATYRFNLYPLSSLPVLVEQTAAGDTANVQLQASLGRATIRATEDIYLQAATGLYAEPLEGSSTGIVSARPNGQVIRREEAFFNAYFTADTFVVALSETDVGATFTDAISPSFTVSGSEITYTGTDTAYFDLSYSGEVEFLESATGTYILELSCYKNGIKVTPSESLHKVYYVTSETEPIQSQSKRFYTQLVNGDVLAIRQNGTAGIDAAIHNFSFTGTKIQ